MSFITDWATDKVMGEVNSRMGTKIANKLQPLATKVGGVGSGLQQIGNSLGMKKVASAGKAASSLGTNIGRDAADFRAGNVDLVAGGSALSSGHTGSFLKGAIRR
jgi:hypothetical protein